MTGVESLRALNRRQERDQVYRFVRPLLSRAKRILEVGCGQGDLARQLSSDGFQVTGLDREILADSRVGEVRWVEADLFDFSAERMFDAIVVVATLHHLDPLGDALSHLRSLLAEGGLLIIDDFDLEAPDESTCRWYYDAQQRLEAAGLYSGDRIKTDRDLPPLTRWRLDHQHEHKLHSGAVMKAALAEQLDLCRVERGPYLYRYVCAGLPEDEIGARAAEEIFKRENNAVAEGELLPVGLRFVAQHARHTLRHGA